MRSTLIEKEQFFSHESLARSSKMCLHFEKLLQETHQFYKRFYKNCIKLGLSLQKMFRSRTYVNCRWKHDCFSSSGYCCGDISQNISLHHRKIE